MTDLVFNLPGKDDPGFLRRQREAIKFGRLLQEKPDEETLDQMVDFLVQFVEEPKDREIAKEALWDASESQFMQLLRSLGGESDENPT